MSNVEAVIETVVAQLHAEFGPQLLGVLVTGSLIHGTPSPSSDLDMHVLIDRPQRQRRNQLVAGLEVEMFINPPWQVERYFDSVRGVDQHMYSFGRSVYDPHGAVARMQALARRLWDAGPAPLDPALIWRKCYAPADWLRDLDDIGASDAATATLLTCTIIDDLLATHYQLSGRWQAKLKRRLADLAQWDAAAAALVRTALQPADHAERKTALLALAAHILAPIGGLMPLEWHTAWEDITPPE